MRSSTCVGAVNATAERWENAMASSCRARPWTPASAAACPNTTAARNIERPLATKRTQSAVAEPAATSLLLLLLLLLVLVAMVVVVIAVVADREAL